MNLPAVSPPPTTAVVVWRTRTAARTPDEVP